jgi:hypothetical protein
VLPTRGVSEYSFSVTSHLQDRFAGETHKDVPLLLVRNARQSSGDLIVVCKLHEPLNGLVVGIDLRSKLGVACRIFMSVVHHRLTGKLTELREGGMHLLSSAFEEAAASASEERVAGEDGSRVVSGSGVVADRVLGMAWCVDALDGDITNGEGVALFHLSRQALDLR